MGSRVTADAEDLSPRDREFADTLQLRASLGKSRKVEFHILLIETVKEIYRTVYQPRGDQEYEPEKLGACLRRLVGYDLVRFVASNDGEKVALPLKIKVRRPPEPPKVSLLLPPLVDELSWLADKWCRLQPHQQAAYTAVNEWLFNNPHPVLAPACERALEVFGKRKFTRWFPEPEKTFNFLSFQPYFSDPNERGRLLAVRPSQPPLLTERYFGRTKASGFATLHAGNTLLVVENHTTCWSLAEVLDNLDHAVDHGLKHLAWGIGQSFVRSVNSILPKHDVGAIRYFGDVDASGLGIPIKANATAAKNSLPIVRPAEKLYDALFALGTVLPGKEEPVPRDDAEKLAAWLPDQHRERTVDLLMKGERLAQEWVGLRYLASSTDWHADVW